MHWKTVVIKLFKFPSRQRLQPYLLDKVGSSYIFKTIIHLTINYYFNGKRILSLLEKT